MTRPNPPGAERELTDFYGRRYRTGVSDRELLGHSRHWMFWLCWVLMLAAGLPQYGYGVLVATLVRQHGWTLPAALSVLGTLVVVQAAVAFPAAWLRERGTVSPRAMVIAGGVLCGAGLAVIAHTTSPLLAVLGYGVGCGAGVGLLYSNCLGVVTAWYPEQSVARVGFTTAAFACGAIPFAALFLTADGRDVSVLLDAVAIAIVLVVAGGGAVLRQPPRDWWPAYLDPRAWALDKRLNRSLSRNRNAVRSFAPREAVHHPTFTAVFLLLVVASALWLGDLAYLGVVATGTRFSAGAMAVTFAVFLGVNGLARAMVGRVSDRFGRRQILAAMLLVGGVAQVLLLAGAHRGALGPLLLGAGAAALGAGCCFPLCSALVRDYFGPGAAPQNFGIIYSAKAIGGVFGIGLVAATGGAPLVLAGTAALGVLGAAAAARLRQPGRPAVVLP